MSVNMNRESYIVSNIKIYNGESLYREIKVSPCAGEGKCLYISDSPAVCQKFVKEGKAAAGWDHADEIKENESRDLSGKDFSDFSGIKYIIEDIDELEISDFDHIYRRICRLSCEILRTERLLVRETMVSDVDGFIRLYSDLSVTRYMEGLFEREAEMKYQQDYIDKVYSFYDCGIWSLCLLSDDCQEGELIGRMGVEIKDEEGTAEFGFMLGTEYQHKGYAAEAGKAVIAYAFTIPGVTTVTARVHRDNLPSRRLCEKLGMKEDRIRSRTDEEYLIYRLDSADLS